jgi:hypothetical protein
MQPGLEQNDDEHDYGRKQIRSSRPKMLGCDPTNKRSKEIAAANDGLVNSSPATTAATEQAVKNTGCEGSAKGCPKQKHGAGKSKRRVGHHKQEKAAGSQNLDSGKGKKSEFPSIVFGHCEKYDHLC